MSDDFFKSSVVTLLAIITGILGGWSALWIFLMNVKEPPKQEDSGCEWKEVPNDE